MHPQSEQGPAPRAFALNRPFGFGWAATLLERASGLDSLARMYDERAPRMTAAAFVRFALDRLRLRYVIASGSLQDIPSRGALIVVSNHPFGASDGLVLADLLLSVRPDVRLLANTLLRRLPELEPLIAPVDVFRPHANLGGLRAAQKHLKQGGVLVMFPSGEVSRIDWTRRRVADPHWSRSAALLAHSTGASILPVHIEGAPRRRSLIAGAVHPRLRTLMLGRDLLDQQNSQVSLRVGQPLPAEELGRLDFPVRTAYLRLLSDSLAPQRSRSADVRLDAAIADEPSSEILDHEVRSLPSECRLLAEGAFEVYCASPSCIPNLLLEIGRLRELSFRKVQEGTGKARDLDRFDASYRHLFVWHRTLKCVIGAYRLGFTDELVPYGGASSLYTHTLFEFGSDLLSDIGPAIELGRSFVRPEWQRDFRSLRLLWSGIAVLLDRHPEIRCLFGPVSISASYSPLARTLMANALSIHHGDAKLRALIKPRASLDPVPRARELRPVVAGLSDPDLLSRVVARINRGSGLPVLLRHYVQLKGRFGAFSVDAQFGNALDGLVFVRVRDIPAGLRARLTPRNRPVPSARECAALPAREDHGAHG